MSSEFKADMFVEGVEFGAEREQRRIIKLLEDNICPTCESGDIVHQGCEGNFEAILLIKGESE